MRHLGPNFGLSVSLLCVRTFWTSERARGARNARAQHASRGAGSSFRIKGLALTLPWSAGGLLRTVVSGRGSTTRGIDSGRRSGRASSARFSMNPSSEISRRTRVPSWTRLPRGARSGRRVPRTSSFSRLSGGAPRRAPAGGGACWRIVETGPGWDGEESSS